MTTQEINITNALQTTKEILTEMIANGLNNPKYTFGLSNIISEKYNLTQDQSILIIESALTIA